MIWITGDTHRYDVAWLKDFCREKRTTKADIVIILGDAGINFEGPYWDARMKAWLAQLPITLFCIHGNHEIRPGGEDAYSMAQDGGDRIYRYGYELVQWRGGRVYREEEFPNLLFAEDGEVYDLDGIETLVVGGAYSVDKQTRVALEQGWWADEQPSAEAKARAEKQMAARDWHIDAVLTHTSPLKYEPVEVFFTGIDQSRVDKTTEEWLDHMEERLTYGHWFCGHFHTDKEVKCSPAPVTFMMHVVREWQTANGRGNEEDFIRPLMIW